jgi:hypothetical protein
LDRAAVSDGEQVSSEFGPDNIISRHYGVQAQAVKSKIARAFFARSR